MSAEQPEETFEEQVTKLPITGSLEPCKKAFFDGNNVTFLSELQSGKYQVYTGVYRDIDDYQGRPDFVLKNLTNGFVHQLEDKRKYIFAAFKCTKIDDKYEISAAWICNSTLSVDHVVDELYSYFTWNQVDVADNVDDVCDIFNKMSNEPIIVSYCH